MNRYATAATLLCLLHSVTCLGQTSNVTTVAYSGDVVEGETIASISQFNPAFVARNNLNVTFVANTAGGESATVSGANIVMRTNTQVGCADAGVEYDFIGSTAVNDGGEIVMGPLLSGGAGGLVHWDGQTDCLQALTGNAAPGTGDIYDFFSGIRHAANGDFSYTAFLENSGGQANYYAQPGATPVLVDQTDTVVGDEEVTGVNTISINSSRRTALYLRKWTSTSTLAERKELVMREVDGSKFVLMQTGDSGLDLPAGTTVKDMFVPKANSAGQVALFTEYQGFVSGTSIHQCQIGESSITSCRSVAKTADAAPGLAGHEFGFFSNFQQNSSSDVAFFATVSPSSGAPQEFGDESQSESPRGAEAIDGIWFEDSGGRLQLAGYHGQQAPGLDPGVSMVGLQFPAFNDLNQVAFKSSLVGPGINFATNDKALWATDLSGELQLVVQTGDLFDVDDDPLVEDLRTVNVIGALASSAGTGGESTSFGDDGKLALMLNFTDFTSGVFLFDLAANDTSVDLDQDGDVDGFDFLQIQRDDPNLISQWQSEYGNGLVPSSASTNAVPEPASTILLLLASAGITLSSTNNKRRRRKQE